MADEVRKTLDNPRFDQSRHYAPGYWAGRFGFMISEWVNFSEGDRIERIATQVIEDAMELVSAHKDKVRPNFAPIELGAEVDEFFAGMGK